MTKKRRRPRGPRIPPQKRTRAPVALVDACMLIYGEWGLAAKSINSLQRGSDGLAEGYRLIVVDNGTPDWETGDNEIVTPAEQAAPVKELLRPQDAFYRLDENRGFPQGYNFCVSKGRSPLVFIHTADVALSEGCLTTLVRVLDNPEVGIAAPMLLFPMDESPHGPPGKVQSAGMAFDIRGDPFHIFLGWSPDHPKVNQRREMQAVTGACFLTRRSIWDEVGGFAALYGAGTYEDMEFCFRVRQLGYKIVFEPMARAEHYVGGSIRHGAQQGGFNLALNATQFKGRWAQALQWDAYRWY